MGSFFKGILKASKLLVASFVFSVVFGMVVGVSVAGFWIGFYPFYVLSFGPL